MRLFIILLFSCFLLIACESTKNSNGNVMPDVNNLEGTWDLAYISGPKIAFEGLYPGSKPFIKFDVANKKISGKTGCNNFSGALVTKDSTIDFTGPIAMTKMYCEGEGEPVFTQALTKVTSYKVVDSSLIFMSGDVLSMRFKKRLHE